MSTLTVEVYTAEMVRPDTNNNKFYRGYLLSDGRGMRQWGSQRAGRTGGQWKEDDAPGARAAALDRGKGYDNAAHYTFQVDSKLLDKATSPKDFGLLLEGARVATPEGRADTNETSKGSAFNVPTQARPTPIAHDAIGTDDLLTLTDRIQDAITLAVSEPSAAMEAYAELQDVFDTIKERTVKAQNFMATLELLVAEAVVGR